LSDGSTRFIDPVGSYILNKSWADLIRARWISTELSTVDKYFILFACGAVQPLFDRSQESHRVLRIVISNLPVPSTDIRPTLHARSQPVKDSEYFHAKVMVIQHSDWV
jgi:hypothetical protein